MGPLHEQKTLDLINHFFFIFIFMLSISFHSANNNPTIYWGHVWHLWPILFYSILSPSPPPPPFRHRPPWLWDPPLPRLYILYNDLPVAGSQMVLGRVKDWAGREASGLGTGPQYTSLAAPYTNFSTFLIETLLLPNHSSLLSSFPSSVLISF
jgi:hypothetical protein